MHQATFVISFAVDKLQAVLSKSARDGTEKALGDVLLQDFGLNFTQRKYDMDIGIGLRWATYRLEI